MIIISNFCCTSSEFNQGCSNRKEELMWCHSWVWCRAECPEWQSINSNEPSLTSRWTPDSFEPSCGYNNSWQASVPCGHWQQRQDHWQSQGPLEGLPHLGVWYNWTGNNNQQQVMASHCYIGVESFRKRIIGWLIHEKHVNWYFQKRKIGNLSSAHIPLDALIFLFYEDFSEVFFFSCNNVL